MAAKELRTFSDIYSAVAEMLKIPTSDTTSIERIKRDINTVYINEVLPYDEWYWTRKQLNINLDAYINTGTVSVTNNSKSITFSSAPTANRAGDLFSIEGFNEIYEIDTHTANSTSATLKTVFNGSSGSALSYKVWKKGIVLPVDIMELTKVWHDHYTFPLDAVSDREFLEIQLAGRKREGFPEYYKISDYKDPDEYSTITGFPVSSSRTSSGFIRAFTFTSGVTSYLEVGDRIRTSGSSNDIYNGDFIVESISGSTFYCTSNSNVTEATTSDSGIVVKIEDKKKANEVYRQIEFYPAMRNSSTLVHIEGLKRVSALEEDTDEPEIPLQDRIVLMYGALYHSWSRIRNDAEAGRNLQLFEQKLARMSGRIQTSTDMGKLNISRNYLIGRRSRRRSTGFSQW